MSVSFSHTTRALHQDKGRLWLLMLPLILLLLILWSLWLRQAEITLYTTSQTALLRNRQLIVAEFSPAALSLLRAGQSAYFRFDTSPHSSSVRLPATLIYTKQRSGGNVVEARLEVQSDQVAALGLQAGQIGAVEVEVERVSPAMLFWRTISR